MSETTDTTTPERPESGEEKWLPCRRCGRPVRRGGVLHDIEGCVIALVAENTSLMRDLAEARAMVEVLRHERDRSIQREFSKVRAARAEAARLKEALMNIRRHQEIVGGPLAEHSGIVAIIDRTLAGGEPCVTPWTP